MSRAKTRNGRDRWESACDFSEWWRKQACKNIWRNNYDVALHAWKESAMLTRKRLARSVGA